MSDKTSGFIEIVLAMDLSLTSPGFAVLGLTPEGAPILLDKSVVKTKGRSHGAKLGEIVEEVIHYISTYEPEHIVREKSFSRFPAATQAIYKVNGAVDYTVYGYCNIYNTPEVSHEISVSSVKKLVTGNGRASKEDVAEDVFKWLRIDNKDDFYTRGGKLIDDLTDACGVGIAYYVEKGLIG